MGSHAPGLSEELTAALDAFRRIVQALRVSSRDAERRVGLSGAQLFALQQLSMMPGASVNDLAARTFTHQSSVSVVISKLVERRLVAKVSAPDDRRRVSLALTDAGRALVRRSPEAAQERLIAGVAALPPSQRHVLIDALGDVARTVTRADGHPPMLFEDDKRRRRGRVRRSRARRGPATRTRRA